jgi:two-component system NarL family response regulator
VLSGSEDAQSVREAIDEGASGYIFKKSDSNEFAHALTVILDGGVYLPAIALSSEQIQVLEAPEISPRKKDVLRALIRGLSNKEIARELFISDQTVKTHIKDIFELLGVHNRTRAVYAVAHLGIRLD